VIPTYLPWQPADECFQPSSSSSFVGCFPVVVKPVRNSITNPTTRTTDEDEDDWEMTLKNY
jgi:hypothetical protein